MRNNEATIETLANMLATVETTAGQVTVTCFLPALSQSGRLVATPDASLLGYADVLAWNLLLPSVCRALGLDQESDEDQGLPMSSPAAELAAALAAIAAR